MKISSGLQRAQRERQRAQEKLHLAQTEEVAAHRALHDQFRESELRATRVGLGAGVGAAAATASAVTAAGRVLGESWARLAAPAVLGAATIGLGAAFAVNRSVRVAARQEREDTLIPAYQAALKKSIAATEDVISALKREQAERNAPIVIVETRPTAESAS